jgi:rod shape-determining protein MreC
VFASLSLMTLDHRQHHLEGIRATLAVVVYPLQYLVDLPFAVGGWASENLAARSTLLEENGTLREQQLTLQFKLQKFEALESENQRLRSLLQSSSRKWERVLIAELLRVDFDPFRQLVLLNKGENDDVFQGHPLLDAHGVLGQVVHVSPFSSSAILITDPSHAVPIQVNRNGLRGLAVGTGADGLLDIPHLPNNADIEVGDLLVTSGLGLRFPPGYPVARVSHIEKDPTEPFATVSATPLAQLKQTREVLLVWPATEGVEE